MIAALTTATMPDKFDKRSARLSNKVGRLGPLSYILLFLLLVVPVALFGYSSFKRMDASLGEALLARRSSVAFLAASQLAAKFDRLKEVGLTSVGNEQVVKLVGGGKWEEAITTLSSIPKNCGAVDRIFLSDPSGVEMADFPALPGVRGKSFADRDWYKGVSRDWKPYVSEMYKRAAEPKYNVVAVAVPVLDADGKAEGILVIQLKLDELVAWARDADAGQDSYVYFIDPHGHAAAHPKYPPQGEIPDLSSNPLTQKVLLGQAGMETVFDKEFSRDEIVAYSPVAGYGWGAVVAQPAVVAFAPRDTHLRDVMAIGGFLFLLECVMAYGILRILAVVSALRDKERVLLESIGDGIAAIDREWTVIGWNRAAERLTGRKKEEAIGKPLRESVKFIRETDRSENIEFIEHALALGEAGFMKGDTSLVRKDGAELPVGDSAAPVFDANGRVIGAIIVFRDVTAERESRMMRSDFAYASHQLRTPVNKACWSLDMAMEEKGLKGMKAGLAGAKLAMGSVVKLVDQLLWCSEVDQGMTKPSLKPVRLLDVVDSAARRVRPAAAAKDVGISIDVSGDLWLTTDPGLVEKAIGEVLDNAVLYNPAGGSVKIGSNMNGKSVTVSVADTGIGIPVPDQPLIFHKFFRGGNFDTTEIIGAGLGLYLASAYVKLLGGRVWFKSEEGKGCTFFISLPSGQTIV